MEILLILPGFILAIIIMVIYEIKLRKDPRNKVHFYLQRNEEGIFHLSIGRLVRDVKLGLWIEISGKSRIIESSTTYQPYLESFNLSFSDYKNLKWEDEPVEVFLNLED